MQNVKMLIVDDYKDNRSLLKQIANLLEYEYIEAENGKQALQALSENEDINLVLMDIEMPEMNGIEAVEEIRKLYSHHSTVPVIAITAHSTEHFDTKLKKAGFDNYITKPYTLDKIKEIVDMYFE